MRNSQPEGIAILFYIILTIAILIGYIGNIVKLTRCDFEPSYKSEVIRSIGVIIPPVGVIVGYMDLKDITTTTDK